MSLAETRAPETGSLIVADLPSTCAAAVSAAVAFGEVAQQGVAALVSKDGKVDAGLVNAAPAELAGDGGVGVGFVDATRSATGGEREQ